MIPVFSYDPLWSERQALTLANPTHQDGIGFLVVAPKVGSVTCTTIDRLDQANGTLADLRAGWLGHRCADDANGFAGHRT